MPVVIAPGAGHVVVSADELELILRGLDLAPSPRARKKSSTQMH